MTSRFGSISFDSNDVIRLEQGIDAARQDRHWLILADEAHPALHWLQSIARPEMSIPVVSIDRADPSFKLHLSNFDGLRLSNGQPVIALAALVRAGDSLSIDWDMPIIVDPRTRRGAQVPVDADQSVQHARPEQAVPLRKSA